MKKLPKFLDKYFWDVEFKNIRLESHKVYILRRILEYGDERAVRWMWKNFKKSEIKIHYPIFVVILKKVLIFGLFY
jgi:hypothetical protein